MVSEPGWGGGGGGGTATRHSSHCLLEQHGNNQPHPPRSNVLIRCTVQKFNIVQQGVGAIHIHGSHLKGDFVLEPYG